MAAQKKSRIPAHKIALYEELIATLPAVDVKGADNRYTAINGNMFSLLHAPKGRLALRLSDHDREQFLKKYNASLFEAYGAAMKEYVAVPDALLHNIPELQQHLKASYAYAKALKPKPTTKSRTQKKSAQKR
jgi:TfoX/Sxy family transcriptional regulator of competence genes